MVSPIPAACFLISVFFCDKYNPTPEPTKISNRKITPKINSTLFFFFGFAASEPMSILTEGTSVLLVVAVATVI